MEFLWVLLILIPLVLFIKFKIIDGKKSDKIGAKGEALVAKKLSKCKKENDRLLNDVVLLDSKGESYQIDHIFINKNGIWIIETKNWSGRIYGSDEQKEWTQVLAYGKEKHRHYSPVKQNLTHVNKILRVLKGKTAIIPLVVFVSADISNVQSGYVCTLDNLPRMVERNYGFYLTPQEIEKYYQIILSCQEKCNVTSEEHSIIREEKQRGLEKGICPNCGGILTERRGQSGAFYGCSNYPKCRFTINKKR